MLKWLKKRTDASERRRLLAFGAIVKDETLFAKYIKKQAIMMIFYVLFLILLIIYGVWIR